MLQLLQTPQYDATDPTIRCLAWVHATLVEDSILLPPELAVYGYRDLGV